MNHKLYYSRVPIGSWSSINPGIIDYLPGMESKISEFSVKTVYKVVIVRQPPFVFLNESTGLIFLLLQDYDHQS